MDLNVETHGRGEDVCPLEITHIAKDGKKIEVLLTTKLVKYGKETAVLGTAVDISERLRKEADLGKERQT